MEVVEVLTHSNIREMFQSTKAVRFLSHLALHHTYIISSNFYMASNGIGYSNENVIGIEGNVKNNYVGIGITLHSSQLNHSCAPNICRIFINDSVIYKVIRPIKSGEQLFVTYLLVSFMSANRK